MDQPIDHYWQIRLAALKQKLEANNFQVYLAPDLAAAHTHVMQTLLPQLKPQTISWGGSMTFVASGLYDTLKALPAVAVIDTFDKHISAAESLERRRRSLLVDLFFTGTNALTERGQLVNLDMIGNRIGGLTFGPTHVVVLIGRNKIVPDVDAAMARIKNYAAPANAMRLDKQTPCTKTAACEACKSRDRICNTWTITEKSFPPGRVKIILIDRALGL
jgi:hypothetical protein